ncbi:hypothetical protein [Mesorhizobium sp. SP-1A]|uniref:hypothetical protein n=1 Tax=Mesorhizobium sp. SP-1A TaxID=3077840 RepID=UPI0028F712A6|nr:hypothetical protein [Mesorhizobium sp. SP-1A]
MKVDRSKPYFEVDYPHRVRITHYPSGDTCLRHKWMVGKGSKKWEDQLKAFFEKHGDVKVMANSRGQLIGNVDDFPIQGASFKVGDIVILQHGELGEYAEEIVKVVPTENAWADFGDFREHYILKNGDTVYWDGGGDAWMSTIKHSHRQRVRKQREGDPTETLEDLLNTRNSFQI